MPSGSLPKPQINTKLLDCYLRDIDRGILSRKSLSTTGPIYTNIAFVLMYVEEQICYHRIISAALQLQTGRTSAGDNSNCTPESSPKHKQQDLHDKQVAPSCHSRRSRFQARRGGGGGAIRLCIRL